MARLQVEKNLVRVCGLYSLLMCGTVILKLWEQWCSRGVDDTVPQTSSGVNTSTEEAILVMLRSISRK